MLETGVDDDGREREPRMKSSNDTENLRVECLHLCIRNSLRHKTVSCTSLDLELGT